MATESTNSYVFGDKSQIFTVLERLYAQRLESKFCDVILQVCGEQILVHSNILAAASLYFKTLFDRSLLPRAFSSKSPQIIQMPNNDRDEDGGYGEAVHRVVDFMYTSTIELTRNLITQILEVATVLQMEAILGFCKDFQLGMTGSGSRVQGRTVVGGQSEESSSLMSEMGSRSLNFVEIAPGQTDGNKESPEHEKNQMYNERVPPDKNGNTDISTLRNDDDGGDDDDDDDDDGSNISVMEKADLKIVEAKLDGNMLEQKSSSPKRKRRGPAKFLWNLNLETSSVEKEDMVPFKTRKISLQNSNMDGIVSKGAGGRNEQIETRETTAISDWERLSETVVSQGIQAAILSCLGRKLEEDVEDNKHSKSNRIYMYTCKDCSYATRVYKEFQCHKRDHKVSVLEGTLHEHVKKSRPLIEYSCDRCEFRTTNRKTFKVHKGTHLHDDNICSFCESQFANRKAFTAHLEKHEGPLPYFCSGCDAKFKTRSQLNIHSPTHRTEKPFKCDFCQAGFKWKFALNSHMKTHKDTKDLLCDTCGFSTSYTSQMKAHLLIHTGGMLKCDYKGCSFQTIKRQNLKNHKLTHLNEKPHQCEQCGESFSLVKSLRRHTLLHNSVKPYNCGSCTFSTTRRDRLTQHIDKHHGAVS